MGKRPSYCVYCKSPEIIGHGKNRFLCKKCKRTFLANSKYAHANTCLKRFIAQIKAGNTTGTRKGLRYPKLSKYCIKNLTADPFDYYWSNKDISLFLQRVFNKKVSPAFITKVTVKEYPRCGHVPFCAFCSTNAHHVLADYFHIVRKFCFACQYRTDVHKQHPDIKKVSCRAFIEDLKKSLFKLNKLGRDPEKLKKEIDDWFKSKQIK